MHNLFKQAASLQHNMTSAMKDDAISYGIDLEQQRLELATSPEIGIKTGKSGPHAGRTIMVEELRVLLDSAPMGTSKPEYRSLITESNVLAKRTLSARKNTYQRLTQLYSLDETVLIFRILRVLCEMNPESLPLIALLCALARDPILRSSCMPILLTKSGDELSKQAVLDAILSFVGDNLNDTVIQSVLRNVSSSWTQSGHLIGRSRKIRQLVKPTPYVVTYALLLGYILGGRGHNLYKTLWAKVLDSNESQLIELSQDAKRLGLIDMNYAGGVIEISPIRLLTEDERRLIHGTN